MGACDCICPLWTREAGHGLAARLGTQVPSEGGRQLPALSHIHVPNVPGCPAPFVMEDSREGEVIHPEPSSPGNRGRWEQLS